MRFGATFLTFFVVSFLLSGLTASFVIVPLFYEGLGETLRPATDTSTFPSMIAGFAIYSLAAAWFLLKTRAKDGWLMNAVMVGVGFLVFITGQYAILPGWSILPVAETIGSGFVSGLPAIPAAIAAGFVAQKLGGES
jgi:hypothetical protein